MKYGDWFMVVLTVECAVAAVLYAMQGVWPKCLYWCGALIINVAVLRME